MGGKSAGGGENPASAMAAMMSNKIFKQTAPIRKSFVDDWSKLMQGGGTMFESPFFSAMRKPIEDQYGQAKQGVLANIPEGGGLNQALTDVETGRASGLADIISQIYMDQVNKAYGASFNAPQTAISGMASAAPGFQQQQQGMSPLAPLAGLAAYGVGSGMATGSMIGIPTGGGALLGLPFACCFNFLEAEGEIYSAVRRYRDEKYSKSGLVSKGYVATAFVFVPLMQKYRWFKQIIRLTMTQPLKAYAKWYYGENLHGFIFWPIAKAWVNSWRLIGLGVK